MTIIRSPELKYLPPITPSMRKTCLLNRHSLWNGKGLKKLYYRLSNITGRNHLGKLILYTHCSVSKKWLRTLSYNSPEYGVPGIVYRIEYDSMRSSFISLIFLKTGLSYYTIHTDGVLLGNSIISRLIPVSKTMLQLGDRTPISMLSHGTLVHSVESFIGSGAVYFRSAGTYGIILKRYIKLRKTLVKFKSGCLRLLPFSIEATIGSVSNKDFRYTRVGKAGRNIWKGLKPKVRGVAMNPIDHPHGGGNGKKSKPSDPISAWGKTFKYRSTARVFRKILYTNELRI